MVRYKRCPQCGTVVLMTMAICPVCDRHFQTTAPYAQRQSSAPWATAPVYSYSGAGDAYAAVQPQAFGQQESGRMDWLPFILSVIGLPWLGMILNHQFAKGMVYLLGMLGILSIIFLGKQSPMALMLGALALIAAYVIGLLDVYAISQRFGRSENVRDWDWF